MKTQIAICLMTMGCTTTSGAKDDPPPEQESTAPTTTFASTRWAAPRIVAGMTLAYILKGDCPNWKQALAIATKKMGCGAGDKPPSQECRKHLPCDVCQFLREGAWPPARIVDFPAKDVVGIQSNVYGAVRKDGRWVAICPIDDQTRIELKQALCYEKGNWGYDKVDTLAKAMVHEAIHLCRLVGGTKPAMSDKEPWEYLFCPGPDTEDLTDICWRPQN